MATSDNQGHGPDVGSDKWKSVIEFKLGIRDEPNLADRDSEAWCRHIYQIVRERVPASSQKDAVSNETVMAAGPSYNCDNVEVNSIEEMICKDDELSALDRKLSIIYSAAAKKATNEHPPVLKAEQRGWIKGRNETFWEHQGEASITWGYGAPQMHCKKAPLSVGYRSRIYFMSRRKVFLGPLVMGANWMDLATYYGKNE